MAHLNLFVLFFAIVSFFSFPLSPAMAAEKPDRDGFELEELVVTATKTEKMIKDVPASVSVITKEDLQRKNYVNLNEALESIPGVYSYQGKGIATPWPVVNLRGFHGHMRTLIMVNGQPLSPNMYALALVHWTAIPVGVVERIEVVRGPFSALYGGDAVGGVVNIITKCPSELEVTAQTGYGEDNTYKVHLSAANKISDKFSLFFAFDQKKTDSYVMDYYLARPASAGAATPVSGAKKIPYYTGGYAYEVGDKGQLHWDENTYTVNLNWDITDSSFLKLNALYSQYTVDPFDSTSYLRDAGGNEVRSGLVTFEEDGSPVYLDISSGKFLNFNGQKATGVYSGQYMHQITKDLDLKLSVGLTHFTMEEVIYPSSSATENGGSGSYTEAPSKIWQSEIQTNYRMNDNVLLTGGISYRYDEGQYKKYSVENWRYFDSKTTMTQAIDPESERHGLYIQGEINLFDNLAFYLGGRYDKWESEAVMETTSGKTTLTSHDKDAFSPKVSMVYKPLQDTTLRLSGGKAFRVPNFFELYQELTMSGTTYLSNPDLDPEVTWSWEIGAEQHLFHGSTVMKATYFENYTKDYIDSRTWTDQGSGITYAQRENFGKTETRGVELEINQKITEYLKGFFGYTYMDAEITENSEKPELVGNRPRYVPEHMFNAGLDFHWAPFSASLTTRYVSKIQSRNTNTTVNWGVYGAQDEVNFVTDLKVGLDFSENLNLSVFVNNMFDEDYYQYSKAPERTFFGMLTVKY